MTTRPTFSIFKRRLGGTKVCPDCKHKAPRFTRGEDGRPRRLQVCPGCGTDLRGARVVYPGKAATRWVVRRFDPGTGGQKDTTCASKEQAEALVRQQTRDWTADPVQSWLIERASNIIRGLGALDDRNTAVDKLVDALRRDVVALRPQTWEAAVDEIASDMLKVELRSVLYIADVRRVAADFQTITGIVQCAEFRPEMVREFHQTIQAGNWKRGDKPAKAMGPHAVAKYLATLRGFVTRAAAPERRWIHRSVVDEAGAIWQQAVPDVEHAYLPDVDLVAIISATDSPWWRAFILTTYNGALRRGEGLRLTWDKLDLQGTRRLAEGVDYPHMVTDNQKAGRGGKKRPKITPLHVATIDALRRLKEAPEAIHPEKYPALTLAAKLSEDSRVFPTIGFRFPDTVVSKMFAEIVIKAGLVVKDEAGHVSPKWTLHSLRGKANDDLNRAGASIREQMALLGHRTAAVNIGHYQSADPKRLQELVNRMGAFGAIAGQKTA